jgi:hypothetical protein
MPSAGPLQSKLTFSVNIWYSFINLLVFMGMVA